MMRSRLARAIAWRLFARIGGGVLIGEDGGRRRRFGAHDDRTPRLEVTVAVEYSTLNYKDGLAVSGKPGVIRKYPIVPGVDLAGVVEESAAPEFKLTSRSAESPPLRTTT